MLRDGAAAQYGSDAIAGVINLRLREARSGGRVTATLAGRGSSEVTLVDNRSTASATARTEADDGEGGDRTRRRESPCTGWVGLPLGGDGFLTVSAGTSTRRRPSAPPTGASRTNW